FLDSADEFSGYSQAQCRIIPRMRAVMFHRYGPPEVLSPVDLPIPVPGGDQVLIRVHATTVTSAECGMRRGEPRWGRLILGPRRPRRGVRVLGMEVAGGGGAPGAGGGGLCV